MRSDLSARELALAAWALVHGLASLLVSGTVPGDDARLRRYQKTLDAVFFEPHPEAAQAVRGRNVSERTYGGRATIPGGITS